MSRPGVKYFLFLSSSICPWDWYVGLVSMKNNLELDENLWKQNVLPGIPNTLQVLWITAGFNFNLWKFVSFLSAPGRHSTVIMIPLVSKYYRISMLNSMSTFPPNICWSWRRLQHVFSVTILRLPRRLEDVLKTSWRRPAKTFWRRLEDVLKTSWRRLEDVLEDMSWRRIEDVLKMSWRHVLKTSQRFYGNKQNTYWGYLYTYLGI